VDGAGPVVAAVERRLRERGAIPFEELMELCLYEPRAGLYRASCPSQGRAAGHYATCAHLDPALGEATRRLGQQDLTCDVNLTDLLAWGESLGLRTLGLWTQRELLERHGLLLSSPRRRDSLAFLADPDGAGGRFRALAQARGGHSTPRIFPT
jgi:SAM-dependent MidA family methyltransferase